MATIERQQAVDLVTGSLRELLEQEGVAVELDERSALFGSEALLDSLGLVTLIIDVEERLAAEHGFDAQLATDQAMSQRNSPFLSVGTLTDYICALAQEDIAS